nr:hypothetical protein [Cryobacterium sp. TMS1-13-1]
MTLHDVTVEGHNGRSQGRRLESRLKPGMGSGCFLLGYAHGPHGPLGRQPLHVVGMDGDGPARTPGMVKSQAAERVKLVVRRQQIAAGVELDDANGGESHERVELRGGVSQFAGSLRRV